VRPLHPPNSTCLLLGLLVLASVGIAILSGSFGGAFATEGLTAPRARTLATGEPGGDAQPTPPPTWLMATGPPMPGVTSEVEALSSRPVTEAADIAQRASAQLPRPSRPEGARGSPWEDPAAFRLDGACPSPRPNQTLAVIVRTFPTQRLQLPLMLGSLLVSCAKARGAVTLRIILLNTDALDWRSVDFMVHGALLAKQWLDACPCASIEVRPVKDPPWREAYGYDCTDSALQSLLADPRSEEVGADTVLRR
jgi:hypothetical protein